MPTTDSGRPQLASALRGKRIAVPENRSLDVFCRLLEERGAQVLRCPLVAILDAPDPQPTLDWCQRLADGEMDSVIWLTGEGVRRTMDVTQRTNPVLHDACIRRLGQVANICRGPKPARELRRRDVKPALVARVPTTDGVIAELAPESLRNQRIGVQLYGDNPNLPLVSFLESSGASVDCVSPYVYADKASQQEVVGLIGALSSGELDAIAFTSAPQIRYLLRIARQSGQEDSLKAGLAGICVASIGPIVAQCLEEHGIRIDVQPSEQYFLKPLTRALETYFAGSD